MKNDVVRWSSVVNAQSARESTPNKSKPFPSLNATRAHPSAVTAHATSNSGHLQLQKQQQYCDTNASFLNATKPITTITTSSYLIIPRQHSKRKSELASSSNTLSRHFQSQQQQIERNSPHHRRQHEVKARTFAALHLNRILLNCVQLNVFLVFLLCTLNFGFVIVPSVSAAIVSNTSVLLVGGAVNALDDGATYLLDYAEEGDSKGAAGHYTHTWAVHIPSGDDGVADQVARDHGFVNMGKIFENHYHFAHHKVSKRSLTPSQLHQTRLDEDYRVQWARQQQAKSRQKRDYIRMRPSRTSSRALSQVDTVPLNDPKWAQMWYLNRGGGLDMNVVPAWQAGITGKGIVVTILDDGLESDHPDIEHNYDPDASYDVNSHDNDPMPHYDMTDSNRHGTRCAGEVAATANNSICAVGIAFGASVGGVRMLDGDVTDAVEARSLSLNPQHIDIYSASWGPDDDGKTVDGPGELAQRAFIEGVTKGRQGKGSIFIWASGNGGREFDNCNCDGYTNSIWTLSISSATEEGHVPWYSEKCSSTLATTYSSGGQSEKQVVTTDLHHSCTVSHTGTSASAPLAAGIAALVLESNTNLTWRDLQHIVVRTAKPANLRDPTWSRNGVGRRISHSFGYGLMDAAAMVQVARKWKTVPEQQRCEINAPHVDKVIPPRSYITLQLTVKHCSSVNYLEHVQAKITLTSQRRGDIQLNLKSPAGTKVTLLTSRIHDVSRSGFNQWPFMSVHTWGESPHGDWQLEIHNEGRYMAQITQWDLIFYGTETPAQPEDAVHISDGLFGNDMAHNDIEYDANLQWRNMQQVGESSVMANDKTNASCLKATSDQRCLECVTSTYYYNGHCYEQCPIHTYAILSDSTTANGTATLSDNIIYRTSITDDDELQSIDRRREAVRLYADTSEPLEPIHLRRCDKCDNSCQRCYGPLNSQCSTCPPGSQLRKIPHTNETFCYIFAERSSGNRLDYVFSAKVETIDSVEHDKAMNPTSIVYLTLILVPALLIILVVMFVSAARRNNLRIQFWRNGSTTGNMITLPNIGYDRVALLTEGEEDGDEADDEEEQDIHGTMRVYRDELTPCVGAETTVEIDLAPTIIEAVEISDSEIELFDSTQCY
ncbi:PREDICTED: furin-like protease 1 isoform X1 [Bactrocera latifrons]|uniref:furin-like protease 1 isoform X1 n=1 Tax=Bactrocera latifrons TaxID=174628 RepID=UPI0008DE71ED|nr:PREDICTED: furin-like protease 1 isoform X1 [Bactrocera latifrons]XP_018797642.1 PREDICTED: furin-like protease 1 isoform X1 [Bactrocera latifrons]XP_018797643.1 PREDICTED: furin-like protease 1 isoform X1 [Bactrocera latifrons]